MIKYNRIILKLSGEALSGNSLYGIDNNVLSLICKNVVCCLENNVQIGLVVGGGNFWRGRNNKFIDNEKSDKIGMLATMMNSIAICDRLKSFGCECRIQSAIEMEKIAPTHTYDKTLESLQKNEIVIFGCGLGVPFFSTDTTAAIRAVEIKAQVFLKATNVDGVYEDDPITNPDCKMYKTVSLNNLIDKRLKVIDMAAAVLCQENKIPIHIFNINNLENIVRILKGENVGTYVFPS